MLLSKLRTDIANGDYKVYASNSSKFIIPLSTIQLYTTKGLDFFVSNNNGVISPLLLRKYEAPILLTYKESLTPSTKMELIRLGVTDVFIVGGPAVV